MDVLIKLEDHKGMAYVGDEREPQAQMTFSLAGEHLLIIDHTEVDDSLRGKGAGKQLLTKVVEYARSNQKKIMPLCPFAKSVFQKDESIRDVLK